MPRVLEKSNFWLADGTFKVNPKMFYQLYSKHVSLSGIALACICAFLSNKTEKFYHRFSEALKILAPDFRPEKILLDFEQAAIQAVGMFISSFTKFYEKNRGARIEKGLRNKPRVRFSTQNFTRTGF